MIDVPTAIAISPGKYKTLTPILTEMHTTHSTHTLLLMQYNALPVKVVAEYPCLLLDKTYTELRPILACCSTHKPLM